MKSTVDTNPPERRHSIFRKILTGYIALTLLIVSLTALVSFFFVRDYSIRTNQSSLKLKAQVISEMLARPGGGVWLLTPEQREEILSLADANLAIIYPDMCVRQFMPGVWPEGTEEVAELLEQDVAESLDADLLHRLLAGETIAATRDFDFIDDTVVFAGAPVFKGEDVAECAVLLYRPLRKVSDSTYTIALMHGAAGAVTLIISIVLAYFIGRMLSNPLIEMSATATRIAEGNYGEQVSVRSSDEVGQLGAMLNLMSTELERSINSLDAEKNKLEYILTSISDGIVAVDRMGCVVHRNKAAHKLLKMGKWEGANVENRLKLISLLLKSMETLESEAWTYDMAEGYTISAICTPIISEDGNAYGAVCLLRDVSEIQRLEKMRRDYIANISHELRTPLTGIRGMVEPLMDGYIETESERQDFYHVIHQETLRLERLIGEMLDLSRLQEGRIQMELEPMDVSALIDAAIRRTQANAKEAEVTVSQRDAREMLVLGNEARIIQVLIVLLDNAISFTKPGKQVALWTEDVDNHFIAVHVEDEGAGIPNEDLPYIWERFFKADRSRLRTKGVGLGLPIAKLIVELMGGQISVVTTVGEGTKFTFTLRRVGE